MAIASNIGGKQALETVQRLLPVLCQGQAHGLTPAQVVAIASNIGGKQALETVQRLLPVLCQAVPGPWPDPGTGGGHRQQWRQAGAGDGAAAVAGAVPGPWPDPGTGGGHRQQYWARPMA